MMTPSKRISPAVNSGLSEPRFHAYCRALVMTVSFMRSRNARLGTNITYHSSSLLMRMGRMAGEAVRAMRLASVMIEDCSRSEAGAIVAKAVAMTLDEPLDFRCP